MVDSNIKGPIPEFLYKVSSSWDLTPIYPKIWAISFEPLTKNAGAILANNIAKVLEAYDDNSYHKFNTFIQNDRTNIYRDLLKSPAHINVSVNNARHFILATRVRIPDVALNLNSSSAIGQDTGGIINGRIITKLDTEVNHEKLEISFLDTYRGFADYIIKPWITALGHRGLKILDENSLPDLRCNIRACCFAKSGPTYRVQTKPTTYKEIIFHNCFPAYCSGKDLNYSPSISNSDYISDARFHYDYMEYKMLDIPASNVMDNFDTTIKVEKPSTEPSTDIDNDFEYSIPVVNYKDK